MTLERMDNVIVSVEPASIEGWTRVLIDFGDCDVVLVSGRVLTCLEIVLDENGVVL